MTNAPSEPHPLSLTIKSAIAAFIQDDDGMILIPAEEVCLCLVDTLASLVAGSPQCETIRGRREFCDEFAIALHDQVKAYQALKGLPISMPPKLVIANGA